MKATVEIYNCPDDVEQYIVARLSNGELWFWGSYEDESEAIEVADEFENGLVVERNVTSFLENTGGNNESTLSF